MKQDSKFRLMRRFLLLFFPPPVPSYLAPAVGVVIYSQGHRGYWNYHNTSLQKKTKLKSRQLHNLHL